MKKSTINNFADAYKAFAATLSVSEAKAMAAKAEADLATAHGSDIPSAARAAKAARELLDTVKANAEEAKAETAKAKAEAAEAKAAALEAAKQLRKEAAKAMAAKQAADKARRAERRGAAEIKDDKLNMVIANGEVIAAIEEKLEKLNAKMARVEQSQLTAAKMYKNILQAVRTGNIELNIDPDELNEFGEDTYRLTKKLAKSWAALANVRRNLTGKLRMERKLAETAAATETAAEAAKDVSVSEQTIIDGLNASIVERRKKLDLWHTTLKALRAAKSDAQKLRNKNAKFIELSSIIRESRDSAKKMILGKKLNELPCNQNYLEAEKLLHEVAKAYKTAEKQINADIAAAKADLEIAKISRNAATAVFRREMEGYATLNRFTVTQYNLYDVLPEAARKAWDELKEATANPIADADSITNAVVAFERLAVGNNNGVACVNMPHGEGTIKRAANEKPVEGTKFGIAETCLSRGLNIQPGDDTKDLAILSAASMIPPRISSIILTAEERDTLNDHMVRAFEALLGRAWLYGFQPDAAGEAYYPRLASAGQVKRADSYAIARSRLLEPEVKNLCSIGGLTDSKFVDANGKNPWSVILDHEFWNIGKMEQIKSIVSSASVPLQRLCGINLTARNAIIVKDATVRINGLFHQIDTTNKYLKSDVNHLDIKMTDGCGICWNPAYRGLAAQCRIFLSGKGVLQYMDVESYIRAEKTDPDMTFVTDMFGHEWSWNEMKDNGICMLLPESVVKISGLNKQLIRSCEDYWRICETADQMTGGKAGFNEISVMSVAESHPKMKRLSRQSAQTLLSMTDEECDILGADRLEALDNMNTREGTVEAITSGNSATAEVLKHLENAEELGLSRRIVVDKYESLIYELCQFKLGHGYNGLACSDPTAYVDYYFLHKPVEECGKLAANNVHASWLTPNAVVSLVRYPVNGINKIQTAMVAGKRAYGWVCHDGLVFSWHDSLVSTTDGDFDGDHYAVFTDPIIAAVVADQVAKYGLTIYIGAKADKRVWNTSAYRTLLGYAEEVARYRRICCTGDNIGVVSDRGTKMLNGMHKMASREEYLAMLHNLPDHIREAYKLTDGIVDEYFEELEAIDDEIVEKGGSPRYMNRKVGSEEQIVDLINVNGSDGQNKVDKPKIYADGDKLDYEITSWAYAQMPWNDEFSGVREVYKTFVHEATGREYTKKVRLPFYDYATTWRMHAPMNDSTVDRFARRVLTNHHVVYTPDFVPEVCDRRQMVAAGVGYLCNAHLNVEQLQLVIDIIKNSELDAVIDECNRMRKFVASFKDGKGEQLKKLSFKRDAKIVSETYEISMITLAKYMIWASTQELAQVKSYMKKTMKDDYDARDVAWMETERQKVLMAFFDEVAVSKKINSDREFTQHEIVANAMIRAAFGVDDKQPEANKRTLDKEAAIGMEAGNSCSGLFCLQQQIIAMYGEIIIANADNYNAAKAHDDVCAMSMGMTERQADVATDPEALDF